MNLAATLKLYNSVDSVGPGSIGLSTLSRRKRRVLKHIESDASPSDLASHHLWEESSEQM